MQNLQLIITAKTVKMDSKKIGKIILFHRKTSGLSRITCAKLAGVGKTAIYDIEHGKETIQLDTLLKILQVLNIKLVLESPLIAQLQNEES